MNIKYFFHILFKNFEKESEEYKKQLIIRFMLIFLLSVLFSLILYFITKNEGSYVFTNLAYSFFIIFLIIQNLIF